MNSFNRVFLLIAATILLLVYLAAQSGGLLDRLAAPVSRAEDSDTSAQVGQPVSTADIPDTSPEVEQPILSPMGALPSPANTSDGNQ